MVSLIRYILEYKGIQKDVRIMMKLGLLLGLRGISIREMKKENLFLNDREFGSYLRYLNTKTSPEEFCGLPYEIANYLKCCCELHKDSEYMFVCSTKNGEKPYSDNAVRIALRGFKFGEIVGNNTFTTHSLRKIISTFANEYSDFSSSDIETILWHSKSASAVQGIYDKSPNIRKTREIYTYWLRKINEISNKLGYKGFLNDFC